MSERRPAPGRRAAASSRRGPGPTALLAVLVPLLAVVSALLVRPETAETTIRPPTPTALSDAALACPGVESGGTSLAVSSLATEAGEGQVSAGIGAAQPLDVRPGAITAVDLDEGAAAPTVLRGAGALAPALLATRSVADPLAGTPCAATRSDQWFTGVGAAAEHRSVLELVNPDAGAATVDVTLYAPTGPVDVPALRGVAVAAGQSARFDLSQVVPRRGDLTMRVQVTRGRLGVAVLDVDDQLGDATPSSDWLPPQDAATTVSTLVGLTRGSGTRLLSVGNGGDDEVRVEVEVVTPRTVFTPEGLDPFRVAPQSTAGVRLDDLLEEATARGAIGLRITATGPVTAGLRQLTPDLSALAPLRPVTEPTAVVVPTGRARLQLVGLDQAGTVTVSATDAEGAELASTQVELTPGTADNTALPRGTALVTVDPGGFAVGGSVVVLDPGAAVLPLTPLIRTSDVPDVRPGLP